MRGSNWTKPATLALTLALPFALACGGGEPGGEMEGEEAGPGQQEAQAPMAAPETAPLMGMGDSDVAGTVSFTREGGSLEVHVMAENLPAAGEYASHIHDGSCDEPGGVVTPLNSVAAPEAGAGQATSTVDATALEAGSSYLVMVHAQEGAPTACANVPAGVVEGGM